MARTILIAGGGIGGLSAALALRQAGFACVVFEQAAAMGEIGAGIQISPNAMHVLTALGVAEDLQKLAFEPRAASIRHYRTGKAQMTINLKNFCQQRYGAKYLHLHRADLHGVLYRAAQAAGVEIHSGARVSGYRQHRAGIALLIGGKSAREGDILVGADGIHSAVRAQMHDAGAAHYTGQLAWRGIVAASRLPAGLIPPDTNLWIGPGRHFVSYYVRGGALVNFVAVEERPCWPEENREENWNVKGDMADVRAAFSGWDKRIARLLAAAETCYLWGLFDRPPLPSWRDGRAVLLGDAAHPMLPFIAQGAASAIEDGYVLARCLAGGGIDEALAEYERIRKPHTSFLQSVSRRNAKLYHRRSHFARAVRRTQFQLASLFPAIIRSRLDAIYGRNAAAR